MNANDCEASWLKQLRQSTPWLLLVIVFLGFDPRRAWAYGSYSPTTLLDRGDEAVLAAPVAYFHSEMGRLELPPPKFHAVTTINADASEPFDGDLPDKYDSDQTLEGDVADLQSALRKTAASAAERNQLIQQYRAEREKDTTYKARLAAAESSTAQTEEPPDGESVHPAAVTKQDVPRPNLDAVTTIPGLPVEFAGYFRGSIAWHLGRTNDARTAWKTLLELPSADRHYRSTWAAYMLGRAWEDEDPAQAMTYYRQVRELAGAGFADRLGLACDSEGREARLLLRQKKFKAAMDLYLEQLAGGEPTAIDSLRCAAHKALTQPESDLSLLAADPNTRRVISAFLITRLTYQDQDAQPFPLELWLNAIEAAQVQDAECAEQLALAAYQAGKWEVAQKWILRAQSTPAMQWLQAKLLLRAGRINDAAAMLAIVYISVPVHPDTNQTASAIGLINSIEEPRQVLGELGVLRLAQGQFTEALDALLQAGFWQDAAYVAERVLTADELKAYVDSHWPPLPPSEITVKTEQADADASPESFPRRSIRYLLARRLARLDRGNDARPYYPAECLESYDAFANYLTAGWNESGSPDQRAKSLFEAARIMRKQGMDLIATEVEPDWLINDCDSHGTLTVAGRATNEANQIIVPSRDEMKRARQHQADPEKWLHYRYQAASLAWEAAKLLPNNTDEKARILCTAGTWLKGKDPVTADLLYKALVRQCRKTAIGAQADRMRWFPELDENGNLVPWEPEPPFEVPPPSSNTNAVENAGEPPKTGCWYVLSRGNTLADLIHAVELGKGVTVNKQEILDANPGLKPEQLKAGQKVFVPGPEPASFPEPSEIGFEYIVHKGDSLSDISKAYREKGVNVTVQNILAANPGLRVRNLKLGQKIFIPAGDPPR